MKIFPVSVVPEIDNYTVENEPILSVNLMERAAHKLFQTVRNFFGDRSYLVLAGPGNNGGDALALSRMLLLQGSQVTTLLLRTDRLSDNMKTNLERLRHLRQSNILVWEELPSLPTLNEDCLVVDGLYGSGLNRPLEGSALELIKAVNQLNRDVVAIDIPSGLMGEDNGSNNPEGIIRAKMTLTFQFPKLAFLFPENSRYVGHWEVLDIQLHKDKIASTPTKWFLTTHGDIRSLLPRRNRFDHKGTMGHTLLIAGSYGKMGAAVLAAKACLRSGTGLLTVQVPHKTCSVLHTAVPEAMVSIDRSDLMFTEFPNLDGFSAVGIGPGIGTNSNTVKALSELLDKTGSRLLVLDADALNILSLKPELMDKLPKGTVLTPHPKEFERLVGPWSHDYERLQKAIDFCQKRGVVLVLKGSYSTVIDPEGNCMFNPTGNPGMATAGSGDVLTGIILALLGRGLSPKNAALAGVYLHGLAGDLAGEKYGEEALIASDIISSLGKAFKRVLQ